MITLPTGSTPVDLAYAVHTEVGHRCIGSRVNGRLVALERQAGVRRRRRDLHVARPRRRGPEPRLAGVRRLAAGQDEDQAVVRQGAPRGGHRGGQGRDHPRGAPHRDAAAAAGVRRRDGRAGPRAALPGPLRAVRRGRGEPRRRRGTWCSGWSRCSAATRTPRRSSPSGPRRRRSASAPVRRRRASWCVATTVTSASSTPSSPAAARPVPGRRHPRLRHPRRRRQRAPHGLHERR